MALLRFLFIAISVLWLIRIVARFAIPLLLKKMVSKVQNQANQQYQQPKPDGRIRVDYVPPREKNEKTEKIGDFVDYEEIK
ncbi:hypothetical protein [Daejeonella oryzae]|uniref:hypothetical protein n=1 Tax=Daejeonella oryzae TaxID=1122943 RepID=UPI00047DB946|nr:hypothetical protein [Daejeonella oryzae]